MLPRHFINQILSPGSRLDIALLFHPAIGKMADNIAILYQKKASSSYLIG
jgi:hypothetical protein